MHTFFICRCLELAEKGRGLVGNGAMVGAVLVRDGKIIAEGFHEGFGCPHAESMLLKKYEYNICSTDILYVNLEPCCHTGKTPPCTEILLERGIKKLVFGMQDPDERVAGKGIALLRSKGVEVIGPILEDECLRLNRGFVSVRMKSRPWITLKMARTIDGRIANHDRSMMKITTQQQDQWAHEFLRARHDAILVGVGTILSDDPRLTVRCPHPRPLPRSGGGERQRQPWRIVLDKNFETELSATVVGDAHSSSTILIRGEIKSTEDSIEKERVLEGRGVTILTVPVVRGQFDWPSLWDALITPQQGYNGITSILVEGGPKTWEFFRHAGCVDQEVLLIGKKSLRG